MKTLLLDCEPTCDFGLLGLVSAARDFRLAWAVNQAMGLRLIRQPDLTLDFRSRGRMVIVHYCHATAHGAVRLLRNRAAVHAAQARPFLLPELASFDFLLHVDATLLEVRALPEWLAGLQHVPLVQYVCPFDPGQLRDWENLLF